MSSSDRWPRFVHVRAAVVLLISATILLFQNCSGFKASELYDATSTLGAETPPPPPCVFNGQTLTTGQSVQAFVNATGTCVAETRVCQSSGVLTGSNAFASCTSGTPGGGTGTTSGGGTGTTSGATNAIQGTGAGCLFNGQAVAEGASVTAYRAGGPAADGTCASESRVCTNGALTGSFAFASCGAAGKSACLFNGQTVADGQSVNAFATGGVPGGFACAPQVRTCANGVLSGAGEFGACVVGGNAPCLFNGQTLAHGQVANSFASSNASCTVTPRSCANGVLSGAGDFASCDATRKASCLLSGLTIPDGGVISRFATPASDVGGACAVEARTCANGALSGSASNASCLVRSAFVSANYTRPTSKEGVADMRYADDAPTMDARYAKFNAMNVGVRIYNVWWSGLETAGVAPSANPVTCPAGHVMVPATAGELAQWGYHHYRCLSQDNITQWDRVMTHDAANGIQSAVVIWSAPKSYRDPNCAGNIWAGSPLFDGCVPRDDAMDDFQDVATFLGARYNGRNGFGKISHFVVWNENASGLWFDYSPTVPNRGVLNAAQTATWINKYAGMVTRVHDAVQKTSDGVLIEVSTDQVWAMPRVKATDPAHIGSGVLINGLWDRLGTQVSWSVAVHPYGDVNKAPAAGIYNFLNVQDLVGGNQIGQLQARGLGYASFKYPQAFLLASEQGWPQSEGIDQQGRNICWAQAMSLWSGLLLGQTHNYFQSIEPQETTGGSSGQGAFFGLLPYRSAGDLSDMGNYSTGAAYLSTAANVWGQNSSNWCCQAAGVGCLQPAGTQPIYRSLKTHHLYSTLFAEGPRAGFAPEMTAFNLYTAPGADLVQIFRCVSQTGDYMLTAGASCGPYATDTALGYAHATPQAGLVPIYRRVSTANNVLDHLATLNANEGAGYTTEGILGYVPAM